MLTKKIETMDEAYELKGIHFKIFSNEGHLINDKYAPPNFNNSKKNDKNKGEIFWYYRAQED